VGQLLCSIEILTFRRFEDLEAFMATVAILKYSIEGDIISFKVCDANENVCHDWEDSKDGFFL